MASFDKATEQGWRAKTRTICVTNGLALAWATTVQGASTPSLSSDRFAYSGRHVMGLDVPLQVDVQPCLCGAGSASTPDHAMVCDQAKGKATLASA